MHGTAVFGARAQQQAKQAGLPGQRKQRRLRTQHKKRGCVMYKEWIWLRVSASKIRKGTGVCGGKERGDPLKKAGQKLVKSVLWCTLVAVQQTNDGGKGRKKRDARQKPLDGVAGGVLNQRLCTLLCQTNSWLYLLFFFCARGAACLSQHARKNARTINVWGGAKGDGRRKRRH